MCQTVVYFEQALLLAADCENYCPLFVRHFSLRSFGVFAIADNMVINKTLVPTMS